MYVRSIFVFFNVPGPGECGAYLESGRCGDHRAVLARPEGVQLGALYIHFEVCAVSVRSGAESVHPAESTATEHVRHISHVRPVARRGEEGYKEQRRRDEK